MHESETRDDQWKVTDWHHQLLDLRLTSWWTRGTEGLISPCDSELWEHGKPPHSGLELRRHVIETHAGSRRRARVSDPALGILEWFSRGQRADREDAGSERVITRVRLYMWVRQSDEETWTNGKRAAHVLLHPTTTAGWASRVTCLRCFGFIWAKSVLCHTDSRQSGSFLLHLQTVDDQNCHHSDY